MALAKYFEDIEERWLEDTSALYHSRIDELFARLPVVLPPAGEVYLTRNNRRMEDIEVCTAGEELKLEAVSSQGAAQPVVELEEGSTRHTLAPRASGHISLTFKTIGLKHLRVSSAGYLKLYSIHAVKAFRVEALPDFCDVIRSLAENPPEWTEASFARFRGDLEKTLRAHEVPQIFIDGIVEYHLGLFHEQQRRPAFRERFQTAYGNLRWFIPYSDIARLICAHYLYCANEFAAALTLCERGAGRLRRTLDFFLGNTRATSAETSRSPAGGQQGLSLLMALPDLLTFQAVDALQEGQPEKAVELCSAVHREITSAFDKERAARLAYVEACARAAQAGTEAAQKMFENLSHSPWPSIAEAARKHLPVVAHG